jgi:hypothetical protein
MENTKEKPQHIETMIRSPFESKRIIRNKNFDRIKD